MPSRKRAPATSIRLQWEGKATPQQIASSLKPTSHMFPSGAGRQNEEPSNCLFHGDNLALMWALLPEYEGKIKLIYADPPFLSGKAYRARIGRGEDSHKPDEWLLDEGYTDAWPDGEAYLNMLYPRLVLMHRLLAEDGTLYLHLDWHANHYGRMLLDEIFGADRLLNEIAWVYHGPSPITSAFSRKHDTILASTKSPAYTFNANAVRVPYDDSTVKTFASSRKAGFGKTPDLQRGKVPEDWWYFPVVARLHSERTGYPTQKPEGLLERIVRASSNEGELVADFFCGSGTLPVVAERSGRNWLAADASARAIHTTRKRLVSLPARPFALYDVITERHSPSPPWPLRVSARAEGGVVHLQLIGFPQPALFPFPEGVNYWEADFEYDGQLFRSQAQCFFSNRKGGEDTLPLDMIHAYRQPGTYRICVRAVTTAGNEPAEAQITIKVP